MSIRGLQHTHSNPVPDTPFLVSVSAVKKKNTNKSLGGLLGPKNVLAIKMNLSTKDDLWEVTKTFAEVAHLHKVLNKEFPEIEVPAMPKIPAKAKQFEGTEWYTFFKVILDDPNFSESGSLRTFVSTQNKAEDAKHTQLGDVIREGSMIYLKTSKAKKVKEFECWCVIRLRFFFFYKTRFDTSPMGMLPLDDCVVESLDKNKDLLASPSKGYKAVGMPIENSLQELDINALKPKGEPIVLAPRATEYSKYVFLPPTAEDRVGWIEAIEKVYKARDTTNFRVVSTLTVQVEKAINLLSKDANGYSDPYTVLHIENQQQRTATIKKTLDPVWHETFNFHVSWYSAMLYVSVWDEDTVKSADFLGKLAIPVAALPVDEEVDVWHALAPRSIKHSVRGLIHLRMKYSFTLEEEDKGNRDTKVFATPLSEDRPIPAPIQQIMQYVEDTGLDVEGLFRLSANSIELNELRRSIDQGKKVDFGSSLNIHNWSGLIKLWLRELPEPALTYDAYPKFLSAVRDGHSSGVVSRMKAVIESLPPAHKKLLAELLPYLHKVSLASDKTRMHTSNLAVVFGPSMLRQKVETMDGLLRDSADVVKVIEVLISSPDVLLDQS